MSLNQNMNRYYSDRAPVYDQVYQKPERQEDLKTLRQLLPEMCKDKAVLEVACGTGYWTECLSQTSRSLRGIDQSAEMLTEARKRVYTGCQPVFEQADMYQLEGKIALADVIFAGFIWSHIPRQAMKGFLTSMEGLLRPAGQIIFVDNLFVEGSNTPVEKEDEEGNCYQRRQLPDGSSHLILKNFPSGQGFLPKGYKKSDFTYDVLSYFWIGRYSK